MPVCGGKLVSGVPVNFCMLCRRTGSSFFIDFDLAAWALF
jgi:hypothetical protein